jgi:hypothetical protein
VHFFDANGEIPDPLADGVIITRIVIDQRDDINVLAGGIVNVNAGTNVFLSSGVELTDGQISSPELPINVGQIIAGSEVRLKGRLGLINAAAANTPNVIGGNTILESGDGAIGSQAKPFLTDLFGTLTARAEGVVYVSEHNAAGTAGNMAIEGVQSDTAGVFLVADGSIVDALNSDFPKITGTTITLTAGGGIGENGDMLETELPSAGTLLATAVNDIFIHEYTGDLNVDHVASTSGSVTLRAAVSILDADTNDGSGLAGKPDVDIEGVSITLIADVGAIGIPTNDVDIHVAATGVLNSSSGLDTHLIQPSGDLYLDQVGTGAAYTAYIAAGLGSIYNGRPSGDNVVSGRTFLFARNNIGTLAKPLTTAVGVLQGESTTGSTYVTNNGALIVDDFNGGGTGVRSGGDAIISGNSPVTVDQDFIAAGSIIIVAHDDAFDGTDSASDDLPDLLTIKSGINVRAMGGSVSLHGGDGVLVEAGGTVQASTGILIFTDSQVDEIGNPALPGTPNADPGSAERSRSWGRCSAARACRFSAKPMRTRSIFAARSPRRPSSLMARAGMTRSRCSARTMRR